jgi:hypothetical protein
VSVDPDRPSCSGPTRTQQLGLWLWLVAIAGFVLLRLA